MRLLTFNTLYKGDVRLRLRALASVLESSSYDVVCLQELMYPSSLRRLLRGAPSFRYHAASGAARLRGGLAILSRHPIADGGFTRYPMARPLRPELVMGKGFQVVRVQDVVIVNTHLSANRDDDWSAGNRYTRVAAGELSRLAGAVNAVDPAVPVVVTGDFNVPRDSAALAGFLAATGARDAMAGDPEPTYRPIPQWPRPPAFDHVLVRAVGWSADARIVLRDAVTWADGRSGYLSDHFGVEATLSVA